MCLKHWTRSLIWNCPLNPQFPRQIRTTWDRSGAVATRIRASDQVAPLHLSLLLGSDGPVFWCASLTSWVLAKKDFTWSTKIYHRAPQVPRSFLSMMFLRMLVCCTSCPGTAGRGLFLFKPFGCVWKWITFYRPHDNSSENDETMMRNQSTGK